MLLGDLDISTRESVFESLPAGLAGVEVGVLEGDFSASILTLAIPHHLWLVDCWEGDSQDPAKKESQDIGYAAMHQRVLDRFSNEPRVHVVRSWSPPAAKLFAGESMDFVYIDANHTRCAGDICAWWPKVKRGGFLMGHDYRHKDTPLVAIDVDAWSAAYGLEVLATCDDEISSWVTQKPRETTCKTR